MLATELQLQTLGLMARHQQGHTLALVLTADLYDGPLAVVASRLIQFRKDYTAPPGVVNFDILFQDLLDGPQEVVYQNIRRNILEKELANPEFLVENVGRFVTLQNLRTALATSLTALDRRGEDALDEVHSTLRDAARPHDLTFDPGLELTPGVVYTLGDDARGEAIKTSIPALDRAGAYPAREELYIVAAPAKGGKSWFLVHLAAEALQRAKNVVYVTLEMSKRAIMSRIIQNLFSVPHSPRASEMAELDVMANGETVIGIRNWDEALPLSNPDLQDGLAAEIRNTRGRLGGLRVRSYRSGEMTVGMLEGYLDQLDVVHGYTPDMVIVDYVERANIPVAERHLEIEKVMLDLRRIAEERSLALVTASQANRGGAAKKDEGGAMARVEIADLASSFAKAAVADVLVSVNRNEIERDFGLARLFVGANRYGPDQFNVLVQQNLNRGQFCLRSEKLPRDYKAQLTALVMPADEQEKPKKKGK